MVVGVPLTRCERGENILGVKSTVLIVLPILLNSLNDLKKTVGGSDSAHHNLTSRKIFSFLLCVPTILKILPRARVHTCMHKAVPKFKITNFVSLFGTKCICVPSCCCNIASGVARYNISYQTCVCLYCVVPGKMECGYVQKFHSFVLL